MNALPLSLDAIARNRGTTDVGTTDAGALNVWGNSLPRADLPPAGAAFTVDGVPFVLADASGGDNVRCEGQRLEVAPGLYDWLYLLAAGERRVEDEVALFFADGAVDLEAVRVSDFWAAPAVFGETCAIESTAMHYPHHVQAGVPGRIWCQRAPITRRSRLTAIAFPHNVALHVFAATLVPAALVTADCAR